MKNIIQSDKELKLMAISREIQVQQAKLDALRATQAELILEIYEDQLPPLEKVLRYFGLTILKTD
jgi:cell division protein FtsB